MAEEHLVGLWPGLYPGLEADTYHADPCVKPALSASLAHTLLSATGRHCWWSSRRLNPAFDPDANDSDHYRIGRAAHELLTGTGRGLVVLEHEKLTTNVAKEARDAAIASGRTWLKPQENAQVTRMVAAANEYLATFQGGHPFDREGLLMEATIIWEQEGIFNRIMVDVIDPGHRIAWDYKTCAGLARPSTWMRSAVTHGTHIRAAHYLDGLEHHFGGRWRYVFLPQEKDEPHLIAATEISANGIDIARRALAEAREIWRTCLERNRWRGYPARIEQVDLPEYVEKAILAREVELMNADELRHAAKPSEAAKKVAFASQAPSL